MKAFVVLEALYQAWILVFVLKRRCKQLSLWTLGILGFLSLSTLTVIFTCTLFIIAINDLDSFGQPYLGQTTAATTLAFEYCGLTFRLSTGIS